MALASDSIFVTPGSGATLATNSPGSGSTEYHVAIPATAVGNLVETEPTYTLQLPLLQSAANTYQWELFNGATSGLTLLMRAIYGMQSSDTRGTGPLLAMRFDYFRSTALSSGGTAFTTESSSTASANFSRWDTNDAALPSTVTCKTIPTSITTGAWLFSQYIWAGVNITGDVTTADRFNNMLMGETPDDVGAEFRSSKPLILYPGQGIACRQGTVTSSGSFTWTLQFTAV